MEVMDMIYFAASEDDDTPRGIAVFGDPDDLIRSCRFFVFSSQRQGMEFLVQANDYPDREEDATDLRESALPEESRVEPVLVAANIYGASLLKTVIRSIDEGETIDPDSTNSCDLYPVLSGTEHAHAYLCWWCEGAEETSVSLPCAMIIYSLEQFQAVSHQFQTYDERKEYERYLRHLGLPMKSPLATVMIEAELSWHIWRGAELHRREAALAPPAVDARTEREREVVEVLGVEKGRYNDTHRGKA